MSEAFGRERMLTNADQDHQLTCVNVFSCDSREIVYDTRTRGRDQDAAVIESVDCETGRSRLVYKNDRGARGAVVTCHPFERKICFIKGLDDPKQNGEYALSCRQGAICSLDDSSDFRNIDSRNIYEPFVPGALRGGSHVHVFSPDGRFVSDTYDDAPLTRLGLRHDGPEGEANLRNVEINILGRPVPVENRPGNVNGTAFSYVVAKLHSDPKPGTDEIRTCEEETFIGQNGYLRADGTRKELALAVIGLTVDRNGDPCQEVFIVDLPEGEIREGEGPLAGTATTRPLPPAGCELRRLTRLCDRKFPGIRGDRHWLRTTPDGAWIGFFAMDDNGILQAFKAETATGRVVQLSHNEKPATTQMTISPDGQFMYYVTDNRLVRTRMDDGRTDFLTAPGGYEIPHCPVVVSPDGRRVAFNRMLPVHGEHRMQICMFEYD